MDQNLESREIESRMKCQSGPGFQKKNFLRTRTGLIRSALENFDPGASNGASNFIFRRFEADLIAFEVAMSPQNLESRFDISISIRSPEIRDSGGSLPLHKH